MNDVWSFKKIIGFMMGSWLIASALSALMGVLSDAITYINRSGEVAEVSDIIIHSAVGSIPALIFMGLGLFFLKITLSKKITFLSFFGTLVFIGLLYILPKSDTKLSKYYQEIADQYDYLKKKYEDRVPSDLTQGWHYFNFDDCGLKISLPAKPKVNSQRYSEPSYGIVGSSDFLLSTQEATYKGACFDYDPEFLRNSSIDDIFAFSKYSALSSLGGPILDENMIAYKNIPGREIIIKKIKGVPGQVYIRMFFDKQTLYNISIILPEGSPKDDAAKWFNSMELTTD